MHTCTFIQSIESIIYSYTYIHAFMVVLEYTKDGIQTHMALLRMLEFSQKHAILYVFKFKCSIQLLQYICICSHMLFGPCSCRVCTIMCYPRPFKQKPKFLFNFSNERFLSSKPSWEQQNLERQMLIS